ncbi:MAG: BolA family protein [Pseudomonadota bacterium]
MSRMANRIKDILTDSFNPTEIEVHDVSEQHRGHAGYQDGGESHFDVKLRADCFGPMTRIERHRAVHRALGQDIIDRIHALSLDLKP